MDYKKRIKSLIKQKGIDQKILAKELNVHEMTVSRWINKSEPSIKELEKICGYFSITLSDFFRDEKDEAESLGIAKEWIPLFKEINRLPNHKQTTLLNILKEQISLAMEDKSK